MQLEKNAGGYFMRVMASTKTNADYEIEFDFEDWWTKYIHEKLGKLYDEKATDMIIIRNMFKSNN